jgi:hypothetical protein
MSTPEGVWSATVELPHRTRAVEITFLPNGVAVVREGEGVAGTGTWCATSRRGFAYELVELIPGGCVVVDQKGRVKADAFHGSGVTRVFDDDGQLLRSVPARVSAVRVAVAATPP